MYIIIFGVDFSFDVVKYILLWIIYYDSFAN